MRRLSENYGTFFLCVMPSIGLPKECNVLLYILYVFSVFVKEQLQNLFLDKYSFPSSLYCN